MANKINNQVGRPSQDAAGTRYSQLYQKKLRVGWSESAREIAKDDSRECLLDDFLNIACGDFDW
jgi:hypothetical protein